MPDSVPTDTDISSACPTLSQVARGSYPELAMHYRKCIRCQTELYLFHTYSTGAVGKAAADVAWIAEYLRAGRAWRRAHWSRQSLNYIYRIEPAAAAALILVTLPIMVVLAVTIAILSRRSPLIRHVRVGQYGLRLEMLKFRTMWGPPRSNSVQLKIHSSSVKASDDPRVTSRFAAWCRRFSLDELPQLFHVLRGEMSFVGPRPLTRAELDRFYGSDSLEVCAARPGMTGLWQVSGRSRLTYAQRRRLDIFWTRHASPAIYFKTLLRTFPRVLTGRDAF